MYVSIKGCSQHQSQSVVADKKELCNLLNTHTSAMSLTVDTTSLCPLFSLFTQHCHEYVSLVRDIAG